MVEGPGATRNGRKVQSVVGLLIREIQNPNTNTTTSSTVTTKNLEGRRLDAVFSVGKEVFLILGPICHDNDLDTDNASTKKIALRFHFGMNGCLMVRKFNDSSKLAPWRKNDKSSNKCTFIFSRNIRELNPIDGMVIEMVSSTWTVVSEFVARSKLSRLGSRDVCGAGLNFDSQAVFDSIIEKRSKSMICDALLDQDRFPGVGNIIKIEGLHNSRVHPRRLVENLSHDELMSTILECRNYAMRWLSSGRAPTKKVYNQTRCGSCRTGRVRMVKMGTGLSRVTFWCENCQPFVTGAFTKPSLCSPNKENISNDECNKNSHILNNKRGIDKTQKLTPLHRCPQHGSKTILLRRVRKNDSSNLHRLFRTCRVPGCQYFSWADMHLPVCGSCRCKTVLRVSKTDRTGGRWFLSCSSSKGNSIKTSNTTQVCSFFQWATPSQLALFDDGLSPLT
ncbi:MAG: formamidopyrimidine-DNA glycosylase [Bacillariaceae sp.]|jgi:formamidopyrimidine-DNA glycosylase